MELLNQKNPLRIGGSLLFCYFLLHFEPSSAQNGRPEIILSSMLAVHVFALPSRLSIVSVAVTTYLTPEDCLS